MHESRPILDRSIDIDWSHRRIVLNRTLLLTALLFAALGIANLLTQPLVRLEITLAPAVALLISALWLLLTYLFSRMRRSNGSTSFFPPLGLACR